jgi:hypothetical protein
MIQKNITEIRNDKILNSKWVVIVIIGFILGLISLNLPIDNEYSIYLVFGAGLVAVYGLLLSQERTFIKIEGNDFIIEKQFFGSRRAIRYNIKKIENIKYRLNVKSNTYTSAGHVRVLGIDTTPESWKKYYYHKEILSFNCNGKYVEIGKWKKAFGAKDWAAKISDIKN